MEEFNKLWRTFSRKPESEGCFPTDLIKSIISGDILCLRKQIRDFSITWHTLALSGLYSLYLTAF